MKCLSIVEPDIGYCQSMSYMVAILLMYVDREDTFNIMTNILNKKPYLMKNYYTPGMPELKKSIYVFLCMLYEKMPKLHFHMVNEFYCPNVYFPKWFMTLFSSKMPIVLTLRIWDIFFIEGLNVIYKIIVAIFKINKDKIMKSDLIGIKETMDSYL